jgi:RNA-directed DNA polymerase
LKRHRKLFEQVYDFKNLHQAYLEARKGKRYRQEVLEFNNLLEENLIQIQNELIWKTYQVGRYRNFFVYEPKKRLIMALPFKDRVVQWAIYRVLNPLLDKRYIQDSYACRVGYGSHKAVKRIRYWLRYLSRRPGKTYALKLDVSKYFYRVDHDVLMNILGRIIDDPDVMWLLETIIRSEHNFGVMLGDHDYQQPMVAGLGMPIGNLTSQMFANLYLNELDQFVKHVLKVKYYARYMDDMIVLHKNKRLLWHIKREMGGFLSGLKLTLNNKTSVRPTAYGVDFCGYRIWPTHIKLRKKTALKMKRRLRYLQRAYARGDVTLQEVNASVQSYMGILKHCNSYSLREKLFGNLVWTRDNVQQSQGEISLLV